MRSIRASGFYLLIANRFSWPAGPFAFIGCRHTLRDHSLIPIMPCDMFQHDFARAVRTGAKLVRWCEVGPILFSAAR